MCSAAYLMTADYLMTVARFSGAGAATNASDINYCLNFSK
jgi:hypothetical protein